MSGRQARRRSQAEELEHLRRHNQALAQMLRGLVRAAGGAAVFAKAYVEGQPNDDVVADDLVDRVVVRLVPRRRA